MKALTLKHPWSFAIVRLGKNIENRTWAPPRHLIGQDIAIHGGRVPKSTALYECIADINWIAYCFNRGAFKHLLSQEQKEWFAKRNGQTTVQDWILPGIVAIARLADVVTEHDSPWFSGPFGWVLEDIRPVEPPVPARGALGLWDWEPNQHWKDETV